jgi:hypothetical protein
MRNRSKLLMAAFAAAVLLAIAVGSASATHLEIPNSANGFKITWNPLTMRAGTSTIKCPVTLEGSFAASTYVKRTGLRVGAVTGASVNNAGCTEGHATLLTARLPWAITYQSFSGTLPTITGITLNLIEMEFQLEVGGISCLMRTGTERPFRGIANVTGGAEIRTFEADPTARFETSGGFFCSFSGELSFSGTGTATSRTTTEAIRIRLI